MNFIKYISDAIRTKSDRFFQNHFTAHETLTTLAEFECAAVVFDQYKKALFYNKDPKGWADLARARAKVIEYIPSAYDIDGLHALLGIITEAGELSTELRKHWDTNDNLAKIKDELGDIFWYIAVLAHRYNLDIENILDANIAKLRARFPDKFTTEAANNRNESVETAALNSVLS